MFKKLLINILLISAIIATCTSIADAKKKFFAKLISFKGDVVVYKEDKSTPVKKGMALKEADRITTGEDSFADIAFDRGKKNVIRIEENSELILKDLNPEARELNLFEGSVLSRVKKLDKESSFIIRTPISVSGARGSGWRVARGRFKDTVEGHADRIFVAGLDKIGNLIGETILQAGWKIFVGKFERPSGLVRLSGLERERWNRWKEDLKGRIGPKKRAVEKRMERTMEKKDDLFEALDGKKIKDRTSGSGGGDGQDEY